MSGVPLASTILHEIRRDLFFVSQRHASLTLNRQLAQNVMPLFPDNFSTRVRAWNEQGKRCWKSHHFRPPFLFADFFSTRIEATEATSGWAWSRCHISHAFLRPSSCSSDALHDECIADFRNGVLTTSMSPEISFMWSPWKEKSFKSQLQAPWVWIYQDEARRPKMCCSLRVLPCVKHSHTSAYRPYLDFAVVSPDNHIFPEIDDAS